MTYRNRVVELIRVRAGDLRPHPLNWRVHPETQRTALRGVLDRIGISRAVIARRDSRGDLALIDGHLRAEFDPEEILPVLVTDLDENEANKLLLTMDSLTEMAGHDTELLTGLADSLEMSPDALSAICGRLLGADEWEGVEPVDPAELPEYDPEGETVAIRITVPAKQAAAVAKSVAEAVEECGFNYKTVTK